MGKIKIILILIILIVSFKDAQLCFSNNLPKPDVEVSNIKLFYINGYKYQKPSSSSRTSASQALITEINNTKSTIDFAIYGLDRQPDIYNALLNAQKRGVKLRWVTDMDEHGRNIYYDTKKLVQDIPYVKTDYDEKELANIPDYQYKLDYQGALMHNKFFVFNGQKVFTGSTNISSSCIGGYNTNIAVLINSKEIAELYTKEFEQMYTGKFHQLKIKTEGERTLHMQDGTNIKVYFLPKDENVSLDIIEKINSAQKYVYVPMFFLTDKSLINSLIKAKKRGIDVRIILDATCASGYFSKHKYMREQGVPVKVENWGGKLHSKSAVIDDEYVIIGSMNWTKQGINQNDENLLIIKNPKLAKSYKKLFLEQWHMIPNKYLKQDPKPEGIESINSCNDGVDNDHDGKTDKDDEDCQLFYQKLKMAK